MKVVCIDADSHNFPNLALMKISAYHKFKGDEVDLIQGIPDAILPIYDKAYISCVFFQNAEEVRDLANRLKQVDVPATIGGSGVDYRELPNFIEHMMPDYNLYPGIDYSLGFTSRGCIRNCSFCIVPQKEGMICDHAPISEFHHPNHSQLILLDNNFLASPRFYENIDYIIDHKMKTNISQGLDIRLLTEENVQPLLDARITDRKFNKSKYHFAFDDIRQEDAVRKGVKVLRDAGVSDSFLLQNVVFYVLVGLTNDKAAVIDALKRIQILKELGVGPFVMRYNRTLGPYRIFMHISRWVNRKIYQYVNFADYDYSDSRASYDAVFHSIEGDIFA